MYKKIILLLSVMTLVACGSSSKKDDAAGVEDRSTDARAMSDGSGDGEDGATTYGTEGDTSSALMELDDPGSALSTRIIYFTYDSTTIQSQFTDAIQAHADFLARHPSVTLSLEGHADERGSREYNLALGERRSQAVEQQMVLLGAGPSQIRVTSYGEERPADSGHGEEAWAQNRRVEILYE
ncbi:MAG: peptidoglycan-associated lipoprotein Pal [Gammaproteobacteria bacterium]